MLSASESGAEWTIIPFRLQYTLFLFAKLCNTSLLNIYIFLFIFIVRMHCVAAMAVSNFLYSGAASASYRNTSRIIKTPKEKFFICVFLHVYVQLLIVPNQTKKSLKIKNSNWIQTKMQLLWIERGELFEWCQLSWYHLLMKWKFLCQCIIDCPNWPIKSNDHLDTNAGWARVYRENLVIAFSLTN